MKNRLIFGAALLFALNALSLGQTSPPRLVTLQKYPPKAMLRAIPLGAKPGSDLLHLSVSINPADPAGFQQFVDSVSNPKSANYRKFISPEEVGRRFGLPTSRLQAVTNYLASQGMAVRLVAKNRLTILADASVSQAQSAFHTSIERFAPTGSQSSSPEIRFSFTTPPVLPSNIAPDIINIGGLEDFTRPQKRTNLTPTQLRTAYGVAPLYNAGSNGMGRTIGISSFDGFQVSNVAIECQQFGLPTPPPITVETIDGGSGSGQEHGEGDLDMQATVAMAPGCNLIIYDGGNNDIIGVLTQEANDNSADIITESYGWELDAGTALSAHNLHLSMSASGITYLAAAGDTGTTFDGFIYPDTDPEVLIVGGTSLTLTSNNTRQTEVGWNNSSGAGGGGWNVTTDTFNTRPAYQVGTGVPSASAIPYRLIPDVSLDADPDTGYLIFMLGEEFEIGGTSGASPTFAGALADCEQQLILLGALPPDSLGHQRFGRINDLLYSFNGDPSVFFDITSGTNGLLPNGQTSKATVGWDTDTGWGPMLFNGFVAKVGKVQNLKSVSVTPTTIEGGTAVNGTVTLASAAPTGGSIVNLRSSDASTTVPTTVTIAAGATTGQFNVTTAAVSQSTNVTITASAGSSSTTASLTVTSHFASALSLTPSSVVGGSTTSVAGTVTLDKAAPSGGVVVALTSNNLTAAGVPSTITVASGKTSATFPVTTFGVGTTTSVQISASAGGQSKAATLTVSPATLASVSLNSTSAYVGNVISGTITLTGPAPAAGFSVTLSLSSASMASLSASSVKIANGQSTGSFTVTPKSVNASSTLTITAKLGTTSKTTTLKILPTTIASIGISATSGLGGVLKPTITVTLSGPAGPSGAKVKLSAAPSAAVKFASTTLTIGSAKSTGTAILTTVGVATNTTVTITGTLNGSKTATLDIQAAVLSNFTLNKSTIKGGSGSVTGTVTLSGPAGPGARSVTLKRSNTLAATLPASVSIAAGKTSATFTISTKKVAANTSSTITATLISVSKTATLAVTH